MRSVVTGCAGFIGSHLTERLLDEGHEVVGIDCFTDNYGRDVKESNMADIQGSEGFTFHKGDIQEMDLAGVMEGADYVFHLAAHPGVRVHGDRARENAKGNILTTRRLLEELKDRPIKKFVYAGSSSIYGDTEILPMKEADLPRPISVYGISKLVGEHLCHMYWRNFEVPAVILRYFTVYGPRQRPDMAFHKFVRSINEGRKITIYGDGAQTRDFTHVSDIVTGTIMAAEKGPAGEIYNIGGGSRTSLMEALGLLERYSGMEATVDHTDPRKVDARDTHADISKARDVLGYEPEVSIKEGLKDFAAWFGSSTK